VARVLVTPRAIEDLRRLSAALGLAPGELERVQRSLRMLKRFPAAGRELTGRWAGTRFLVGPWPWMILVYVHDEADDAVYVVAVHDGRSASSATGAAG
jgi:plasmid stabilization system protein ParE